MKRLAAMVWMLGVTTGFGQIYFEAGPWFRGEMGLRVEGGSQAAADGVLAASPGARGGEASVDPLTPGDDGTAQILRVFENGYVGPSGWPIQQGLGVSQYFGYESVGQYDSGADTLTFLREASASDVERRTQTSVSSGAAGWGGEGDLDAAGALVTVGCAFLTEGMFEVSAQIQAGWLDGIDAEFGNQAAWSQQVTWVTRESREERSQSWAYVYDTLGNPAFPTAPYAMTDPSGVGPMIADRPASIEDLGGTVETSDRVVGRRTAAARSRVDLDVDAQALAVALGPRVRIRPVERVSILAQGGVTATLLDADLERAETFAWEDGSVIQAWSHREDAQEWLWGGTVSAGVQVELVSQLYLHAAAGYDWVEDCGLGIGPDRVEVDLDGWRAEIALGWRLGGR